jgi:aryl-alcohol dehydrogenase-like predicted oxidoreductase
MKKKINILNKIIIGTAQLSNNYGIFNKLKSIQNKELKKILNYCKKQNIFYIDLANSYKNSINKLSKNNLVKFKIILKVGSINKNNYFSNLKAIVEKTLKELKVKKIYSLMLHDERDIKYLSDKKIMEYFLDLKKKNIIQKIGLSIYNFKKLKVSLNSFPIDLIQVPFNIFDRRILDKKIQKIISKNKIEVHARSIFLQGLLLQDPSSRQKIIQKNQSLLNSWDKFNEYQQKKKIMNCIKFVSQFKKINKFVFGVDNLDQLKTIVSIIKEIDYNIKLHYNFKLKSKKIVDPRLW